MKKVQISLWLEKDLYTRMKDKANDLGLTSTAYIKLSIHEKIRKDSDTYGNR
jgi:predicted DNA-binding protein